METKYKFIYGLLTLLLIVAVVSGGIIGTAKPKLINVTIDENLKNTAQGLTGATYNEGQILNDKYLTDIKENVKRNYDEKTLTICNTYDENKCIDRMSAVIDFITNLK